MGMFSKAFFNTLDFSNIEEYIDKDDELTYNMIIGREGTRKDTEVNEKTGGRTL